MIDSFFTFAKQPEIPFFEKQLRPKNSSLVDFESENDNWQTIYADHIIDAIEQDLFSSATIPIAEIPLHLNSTIVYAIFYKGVLQYIGSSSNASRLKQHQTKLRGASKIKLELAYVRYAIIQDDRHDIVLMVEKALIARYNPPWQSTGYGRRPGDDVRETGPNAWALEYGYSDYTEKAPNVEKPSIDTRQLKTTI